MSTVNEQFENQFIIRFPPHIAQKLHDQIKKKEEEQEKKSMKSQKSEKFDDNEVVVSIKPQFRQINNAQNLHSMEFDIKVDDFQSTGDLVDLPTIIESKRTKDKIHFFKSNDISQMIVVHDNQKERQQFVQNSKGDVEEIIEKIEDPQNPQDQLNLRKFKTYSGLCPVTKNIGKKFYRKKPQIEPKQINQVEEKMKNIIDELTKRQDQLGQKKEKKKTGPKPKEQKLQQLKNN